MTKLEIAKARCCEYHKGECLRGALTGYAPCKPDDCRYYDRVVVRCAAIAAGMKGGKQ